MKGQEWQKNKKSDSQPNLMNASGPSGIVHIATPEKIVINRVPGTLGKAYTHCNPTVLKPVLR